MVAVVVVSHGNLASALLATAEMIAGGNPRAVAVELGPDEAPEGFRQRLLAALRTDEEGTPGGWLLLTDLFGGTPHRVASLLREDLPDPELSAVVSGASLAMVVDALLSCEGAEDAASLARHVASVGLQQVRDSMESA